MASPSGKIIVRENKAMIRPSRFSTAGNRFMRVLVARACSRW
jgi:hypothetical protein